jgi:23S rRNA pseudouridine955/2504/2580 synthase
LIVHSDENEELNTLINHIKLYLYNKGEYVPSEENSFAPALCNRIDRNTSGLVIAAKNAITLKVMNEKIKARELDKIYLCAVHGIPQKREATLRGFLEKISAENRVVVHSRPTRNAKESVTKYKVVAVNKAKNLSLLEVELITGRTHQIRSQLAEAGYPLLGDGKYAVNKKDRKAGYSSQALSAHKLTFKFVGEPTHLDYLSGRTFYSSEPEFLSLF